MQNWRNANAIFRIGNVRSEQCKSDKLMLKKYILIIYILCSFSMPFANAQHKGADSLQTRKKIRGDVKDIVAEKKNVVTDSVPGLNKASLKRAVTPSSDSVGVSYQDGKWNAGNPFDGNGSKDKSLEGVIKDKQSEITDTETIQRKALDWGKSANPSKGISENAADSIRNKLSAGSKKLPLADLQKRNDSIQQLLQKRDVGVLLKPQKVYSEKALKKIYDSLGLSKMDTLLALAASKREVTKEEMLDAINFSMPSTPSDKLSGEDYLNESKKLAEGYQRPDLSTMKLPTDALRELPPMRGYQIPSDSIPFLDSLRNLNLKRSDLKLKQTEVSGDLEEAIAKEKSKFWDRAYIDGVLSYLKDGDANLFQLSPSLGYHFTSRLSVGLGPSVLVKSERKKWSVAVGYRAFLRIDVLPKRLYAQLEDNVEPGSIHSENIQGTKHSILTGAGLLVPVSRLAAINVLLMYRVNNENYAGCNVSPWVFRLGISNFKSAVKK
jgi:hypothetical protein